MDPGVSLRKLWSSSGEPAVNVPCVNGLPGVSRNLDNKIMNSNVEILNRNM